MKTLSELVREREGVWPQDAEPGILVGWNGVPTHNDEPPDYIRLQNGLYWHREIYRQDFEAEARRQGYVEGFEGNTDDVAFKGHDLPAIGEECEIDSHGTGSFFLCIPKYHGVNSSVVEIWSGDTAREVWIQREHAEFRPLKSDRERWEEAAESITMGEISKKEVLRILYDALISGELPIPEAK